MSQLLPDIVRVFQLRKPISHRRLGKFAGKAPSKAPRRTIGARSVGSTCIFFGAYPYLAWALRIDSAGTSQTKHRVATRSKLVSDFRALVLPPKTLASPIFPALHRRALDLKALARRLLGQASCIGSQASEYRSGSSITCSMLYSVWYIEHGM